VISRLAPNILVEIIRCQVLHVFLQLYSYSCIIMCVYTHTHTHIYIYIYIHLYCFSRIKQNKWHDLHGSLNAFDVCEHVTFRHVRKGLSCLLVRVEQLGSHWTDFYGVLFWGLLSRYLSLVKMCETVRSFT
jgi:hypothetical protein